MVLLTQFLFRLALGLALAMAVTSPRLVSSGYFRNHTYVLLGINVLAALVALGNSDGRLSVWLPILAAAVSYAGSVCWLYERPRAGIISLGALAALAWWGAWRATEVPEGTSNVAISLHLLETFASGLLLGTTMAAMLLGHWYLNTPGMKLGPLYRLLALIGAAVVLRAGLSGVALAAEVATLGPPDTGRSLFILLRWLAGLVGTAVVVVMAWQTLKVPNTQSATGILYVGVITTFLGELTAMLLSVQAVYPL